MEEKLNNLIRLIESSERILITSHISPDPDSLCSVLLSGTALMANYPGKRVFMSMEEITGELAFLEGYNRIKQEPLIESVNDFQPNLIIIVDAMNYARCTRGNPDLVKSKIKQLGTKTVIIDHHEPQGVDENNLYINNHSPACVQDAYELFVKNVDKKPIGYAQTTMLGIISDTNRFMYDNPGHRTTFGIVSDLIDKGVSIEQLENMLSRYSHEEMLVIGELAINTSAGSDYNTSFISDEFVQNWVAGNKSVDQLKLGCERFVSDYIRNIGKASWGFITYKDLKAGKNTYSVSLRSLSGYPDVSKIAQSLGGGGHKAAAGAKFEASSVEDATKKVQAAINSDR